MKPRDHALLGLAAAVALAPRIGRNSAAFLAGSRLIDVDHLGEYLWWSRRFPPDLRGFLAYQDALWREVRRPEYLALDPLHTAECLALVGLASRRSRAVRALFLGMLYHRALDLLHDWWHGVPDKRAVSIVEYVLRTRSLRRRGLDPAAPFRDAARWPLSGVSGCF